MNRFLAAALALLIPAAALAQTAPIPPTVRDRNGVNISSTAIVCVQDPAASPVVLVACGTGGGGGGGSGDASAANQTTQITAANLTNTRLGDVTTPANGSVNQRLSTINGTLGSPFQAGGSIGNTAFGISGSLPAGTNAIGSVTGQGAVTTSAPSYSNGTTNSLSLTTGGGLRIDGSGFTQPISASSLPLPTGAATASGLTTINTTLGSPFQAGGSIGNTSFGAKLQDASGAAFGTSGNPIYVSGGGGGGSTPTGSAGSPNANVVSVQGISGGTAVPVSGTFYQATQPVSGTVTAAQATAANLNATVVGTGTLAVQNTAATPTGTNSIGTVGLNAGSNAIGSITNTSFAATQATAANLNATVVGTGTFVVQNQGAVTTSAPSYTNATNNNLSLTTAGALRVDNSAVTQPISGSLTNISGTISLPTGAATSANQTTGNTSLSTLAGTVATAGSTAASTTQQVAGYDGTNAQRLRTDGRGAFVGAQGTPTSTRTTLTASTATALEAAGVSARIGQSVSVEAALTANLFLCWTQTTSCSATVYDAQIPSGAGAGTVYTPIYATQGRIYAYSTGTPVVVLTSWVAQ